MVSAGNQKHTCQRPSQAGKKESRKGNRKGIRKTKENLRNLGTLGILSWCYTQNEAVRIAGKTSFSYPVRSPEVLCGHHSITMPLAACELFGTRRKGRVEGGFAYSDG